MLEQVQLHLDFQGLSDLGTEDVRHQALGRVQGLSGEGGCLEHLRWIELKKWSNFPLL